MSRCASTPRRLTVEVSVPQGPQQAGRSLSMPRRQVRPIDVRVQSVGSSSSGGGNSSGGGGGGSLAYIVMACIVIVPIL